MGQFGPFFPLFGPEPRRTLVGPEPIQATRAGATRADASGTRRRRGASRGRDGAARGEGDVDRFPSKVLALCRLLAGKASPSSSSPSSLPGARVLVGRVLVLEERREVAQERVRGEAVGGGPLLLLGRRQVVGDVEEGELLLLLLSFCCLLLLREAGWMDG